jgi:hypothetical protein
MAVLSSIKVRTEDGEDIFKEFIFKEDIFKEDIKKEDKITQDIITHKIVSNVEIIYKYYDKSNKTSNGDKR